MLVAGLEALHELVYALGLVAGHVVVGDEVEGGGGRPRHRSATLASSRLVSGSPSEEALERFQGLVWIDLVVEEYSVLPQEVKGTVRANMVAAARGRQPALDPALIRQKPMRTMQFISCHVGFPYACIQ